MKNFSIKNTQKISNPLPKNHKNKNQKKENNCSSLVLGHFETSNSCEFNGFLVKHSQIKSRKLTKLSTSLSMTVNQQTMARSLGRGVGARHTLVVALVPDGAARLHHRLAGGDREQVRQPPAVRDEEREHPRQHRPAGRRRPTGRLPFPGTRPGAKPAKPRCHFPLKQILSKKLWGAGLGSF